MTEKKSEKPAVFNPLTLNPCLKFIDGEPVYDLLGEELVFPVIDGQREFYVHMKPYRAQPFKDMMGSLGFKMQPTGSGVIQMLPSDTGPMHSFFWDHFIGLSGVRKKDGSLPSVEEQKAFVRDNPRLRIVETVILAGYGGIRMPPLEEEETDVFVLDDIESREQVRTYIWLHDPQQRESFRVFLTHQFRPAKEKDARIYARATGQSQMNTRKNEMMRRENFDALELLYRDMIETVSGFVLGNEPCTAENRDRWVKLIPLWHATNALDEYFRGVQGKNV